MEVTGVEWPYLVEQLGPSTELNDLFAHQVIDGATAFTHCRFLESALALQQGHCRLGGFQKVALHDILNINEIPGLQCFDLVPDPTATPTS